MAVVQQKSESQATPQPTESTPVPASGPSVQLKGDGYEAQAASLSPASGGYDSQVAALQMKGGGGEAKVHAVAESGLSGGGGSLPHGETIQQSFGSHDVSSVQAYKGGAAADACNSLGAEGYATGNSVAFKSASPDLHTSAHEAAHVVQQRAGVQLKGGVGKAGDTYERHADAVADAVVQGKSAEPILSSMVGGGSGGGVQAKGDIQFTGHALSEALPEDAPTPGHSGGRGGTNQRQYSVEQYIEMFEQERGREMTPKEKKDLARGCIGITVINIHNATNPPLNEAYASFEQAEAKMKEWNAFVDKNRDKPVEGGLKVGDFKAVLFAKLFWSNQKWDPSKSEKENRLAISKKDPEAFKPDADTGKVDMTGYEYIGQPRMETDSDGNTVDNGKWYVNFDYGFWDEKTSSFWHANHAQPGMKVYQSTKDKFAAGYTDFDRVIYCVAWARDYDAGTAAASSMGG